MTARRQNNYFLGLSSTRRRNHNVRATGSDEEDGDDIGYMQAIANSLMNWTGGAEGEGGVMGALAGRMREVFGAGGAATDEERQEVMDQVSHDRESSRQDSC